MDTQTHRGRVLGYWRGKNNPCRVEMKKHDTGQTISPAMVHIFTMSLDEPGKVRQTYGAVGPEKF